MKKYLIASLCIAGFGGLVSAQDTVIAEYTFDEVGTDVNLESVDTDTDTTATTFGSGAGFTLNQGFGAIIGTTEGQGLDDGTTDDLADAITKNEYYTFTVNAVGAATIDLESFSFDYGRWLRGAQDFYLFSSVDGFTDGDELLKVNDIAQSTSTAVADTGTANFDFSTVVDPSIFEGLTSVEFRIYVDDRANNTGGGSGVHLDNVIVNATVNSGANPIASFSVIECTADLTTGEITLTWNSATEENYSIDGSNDLVIWEEIADSILSEGQTTTYSGTGLLAGEQPGAQPKKFYRVRISQ